MQNDACKFRQPVMGFGIKDAETQTKIQPDSHWGGVEGAEMQTKCHERNGHCTVPWNASWSRDTRLALHKNLRTSKGGKTRPKADSSSKEVKREAGSATSYTKIHLQTTASKTAGLLKYCIV